MEVPATFTLKGILDYFLSGEFIIPFGIFFLIWVITKFAGSLFEVANYKITEWIRKKFDKFNFIKPDGALEDAVAPVLPDGSRPKRWTVRLYEITRRKLTNAKLEEIDLRLKYSQVQFTSDFVLVIRSIIAIIIYFCCVEYFGGKLFTLLIFTQFVIIFLVFFGYQLAALIPIVGSKYSEEYRKYQEQHDRISGIIGQSKNST